VSSGNYNTAILPRTYTGDIIKNPVGTGPFMLDVYTPKQKATFKKNPTYWGKDEPGPQLPYLDPTEYTMVEDNSAQNLQLQSGAQDLQPQTVFQGAQALFQDPNLRVDIYPGTGIREVAFNTTVEPWNGANGTGFFCDPKAQLVVAYGTAAPGEIRKYYREQMSALVYGSLTELRRGSADR